MYVNEDACDLQSVRVRVFFGIKNQLEISSRSIDFRLKEFVSLFSFWHLLNVHAKFIVLFPFFFLSLLRYFNDRSAFLWVVPAV